MSLPTLPVFWLSGLLVGDTGLFQGLGIATWRDAFTMSSLSLLYLGVDTAVTPLTTMRAFSEAVLSLTLVDCDDSERRGWDDATTRGFVGAG